MTAVMMIGGGIQEIPAVQVAKSLGFKVIVTDRNPNAPAFPYADISVVIDGRDIENLIAFTLLQKQRLDIAGVFTLTELVTSVSAVAQASGLPGVSMDSAVSCQNKAVCKGIWQRKGIPTPRGNVAYSFDEALIIQNDLKKQVFVKPVVGFGGKGAGPAKSPEELEEFFARSNLDRSFEPMIVEELVTGTMHDVNGLLDRSGTFHPLGIVDRYFLDEQPVEREIRFPSLLAKKQQNELYELLGDGVRALGIHFGPVKGDAVLTESGFQLLEVAPRLHGPKNSLYASPMSGIDPLLPVLLAITDQSVPADKLALRQDRHCICRALLPSPGRILHIEGVEEAWQLQGVEHIMLFASEGDVVSDYRDSTHVPGYIFATAESFESDEKIIEEAMSIIHFEMQAA